MSERGQRALEMCQWNQDSTLTLLRRFIQEKELEEELEAYFEVAAIEEMDENQPGWESDDDDNEDKGDE